MAAGRRCPGGRNSHRWLDGSRTGSARSLEKAPYYAIPVHSGTLGTTGGPRTNTDAQVVNAYGHSIEGLYAAGNVMAGVTGMFYDGAGGTLSPALTFGYIAGSHAAASSASAA
ncbi:FAD-binding protein [Nocardia sp. NPDC019395]|uniref:FAD-binding protein n=1 Tax=Nocardia sp. NPDC019395 TaxID=3154686 RepID=UPI0034050C2F